MNMSDEIRAGRAALASAATKTAAKLVERAVSCLAEGRGIGSALDDLEAAARALKIATDVADESDGPAPAGRRAAPVKIGVLPASASVSSERSAAPSAPTP